MQSLNAPAALCEAPEINMNPSQAIEVVAQVGSVLGTNVLTFRSFEITVK